MDHAFNGFKQVCKVRVAWLGSFFYGHGERFSLGDIYRTLNRIYCQSIGIQYKHIDDVEVQSWLRQPSVSAQNSESTRTRW